MIRHILLVDAEPALYHSLYRTLFAGNFQWTVTYAADTEEGLAALASHTFDAVISDIRPPTVDGLQLLREAARRQPAGIRIATTAAVDREEVFRILPEAHHVLGRPCDTQELLDTLARTFRKRQNVGNEGLVSKMGQIRKLPSLPAIYEELVAALQGDGASFSRVARIVSRDVAITAQLLKLVNSAYFGLKNHVTAIDQALRFLGIETFKSLVLTLDLFGQYDDGSIPSGILHRFYHHSLQVATVAREIAAELHPEDGVSDRAYTAALLHDVGKLVMAANLADRYIPLLQEEQRAALSLCEAERDAFGTTHADVGAYLLELWRFPEDLVAGVAAHHAPEGRGRAETVLVASVHMADALVHNCPDWMDRSFLAAAGIADDPGLWRDRVPDFALEGDPDAG